MKPDLSELLQRDGGSLRASSPEVAYATCRRIAMGHYENFPVGSVLLPAAMRPHLMAIYAFARIADDVADEPWTTSPGPRLKALTFLNHLAREAKHHVVDQGHPVLVALSHSMQACRLPLSPFLDLLEAFRRDVRWIRPRTWDDVLAYCRLSAAPVGRLVLRTAGVVDATADAASDAVCSALQLVNFWQDLSVDIPGGRHYLPSSVVDHVGPDEALIQAFGVTRRLFAEGSTLTDHVPFARLRAELRFVQNGGQTVLATCERLGSACYHQRPALERSQYLRLAVMSMLGLRRPLTSAT